VELHQDFIRAEVKRGQMVDISYSELTVSKISDIGGPHFDLLQKNKPKKEGGFSTTFNDIIVPSLGGIRLYDWLLQKTESGL
jgi:hypothetical protein